MSCTNPRGTATGQFGKIFFPKLGWPPHPIASPRFFLLAQLRTADLAGNRLGQFAKFDAPDALVWCQSPAQPRKYVDRAPTIGAAPCSEDNERLWHDQALRIGRWYHRRLRHHVEL